MVPCAQAKTRSFAERTWDSSSELVQGAFDSARVQIAQEQREGK